MTAWRVGVAIKPEQEFGVEDTNAQWHYVGVGIDMNFSENNNWRFQNGMGSKTPQLVYEGRFSAQWSGKLYLDYNNFYWLLFGLEDYAFKKIGDYGYHLFSTSNKKSIKSFSMRFLKLDREVGGPYDENIVLLGCTMNKVNPVYEGSSTSAISCSIGGGFVDTVLSAENLSDTVIMTNYVDKNKIVPMEWGCLQVLNEDGDAWEKIANNEKTSFTFSRTINTVPDCGERIDTAYYESAIQPITITSQVYSRNGNQWHTRMHSGGIRNDIAVGQTSSPRRKGLQPIPDIRIASGTATESPSDSPDYSFVAQFEDATVDNWGNSYNSNSEITESPTIKAVKGVLIIKTPDVVDSIKTGASAVRTVTYNFNNGTVPDLVMYYPDGYEIKLIDYKGTKTGNTFEGWMSNNVPYKVGDPIVLNADMNFTANWQSSA